MLHLLGLDFGSTNVKCVAWDLHGNAVSTASCATPVANSAGQFVYPAERSWETAAKAIRIVTAQIENPTDIAAMAVTSLGESVVPIDAEGKPLFAAVAWFDACTIPAFSEWDKKHEADSVFRVTGLQPNHILSAFKVLWLKRNHPEVYRRVIAWLPMADYVSYKLTGKAFVSSSLASRTMLFDLSSRAWSKERMEEFGLDAGQWPEVVDGGQLVGHVTASAAKQTGLVAGMPVVAGGHDHVCGALAAGAFKPGIVLNSMGTAEAIFATVASPPLDKPAISDYDFGCHVAKGLYYAIAGIIASGGLLRWCRNTFWGEIEDDNVAFRELERAAATSEPGARGVRVVPSFDDSCGEILGLSLTHTSGDIARAVMEGLSYKFRKKLTLLQQLSGQRETDIRLVGGGARIRLWRQIKADVTGRDLQVPQFVEAGCLGAALLAGIGVGVFQDESEAVNSVYAVEETVRPNSERHALYDKYYSERNTK